MSLAIEDQFEPHGDATALPPAAQLLGGEYEVHDLVDWGPFGLTYLGTNSRARTVVVQEFFPEHLCVRDGIDVTVQDPADKKSFDAALYLCLQEGRSFSQLFHPAVAAVEKTFEENGTGYLVSEFVEGKSLQEYIDLQDIKPDQHQVRTILVKLLDGLEQIHNSGLLHRDINPENIIITDAGEPILINFGSPLKAFDPEIEAGSEWPKSVNSYDPHEFFVAGSKQVPSADLYSLAACFYHWIAGETPPDCQDRMAALLGNGIDPYVPLNQLRDDFDPAFCNAMNCALAILPRYRIRSAREWRDMLTTETA